MKRCVIATQKPWIWMDQFPDHSIMVINPDAPGSRYSYLLSNSDYSLLVTDDGVMERDGGDYPNEKVFWYTSGTTGDSKFYGFTHDQVDRMASTICQDYDITANDRYYGVMPLWHAHGNGFYWAVKKAGCECEFGSIRNRDHADRFQPTFMTSIPDMMPIIARLNLRHLRFLRTASAALPSRLFHDLQQTFRVPIIEAFGMTETLSHCFTNPLQGEQRVGTIGLPSGIEARIDDQQHLWISGPSMHTTAWFDTGDLASQDPAGYFRILGRSLDRINVRGYKIDPLSVENQLYNRFPEIRECAVFGRDRLKCIVVGEADLDQVRHFLSSLAEACRPRLLVTVDSVPKNANGKISRSLLDSMY
jgi:acyl-coenzyme A synthetase/AMP-(fatty) acid ligase